MNAPNIYQRNGELVSIVREPDRKEPDHDVRTGSDILLRPGTPRLRRVPYTALLECLAVAATWEKFDPRRGKKVKGKWSGEWMTTNPDHLTAQIVAERADWPGILPVRSILETPYFAPGGRLISSSGYDEETCAVLIPSCEMAPILEEPSQEDARRALQYLWVELFSDFPYRGIGEPGADDTDRCKQYEAACRCPDAFVAIAALLTMLARHAVEGSCPGFVFEAATQGSGKSLQINVVSIVASSRSAGMMTLPVHDGHVDEAELDKVIGSYALAGARLVAFDNIKGSLGGQRLEAAITANPTISCRVLGASDVRDLPWSAIVMFSGNNMTMSDDVSQRVLVSRLESPREDPRGRPDQSFRHRDLVASVRQLRPSLLQAALTVLRAFFVAHDKPDSGTWGSFEAWSRIVASCHRLRWRPQRYRVQGLQVVGRAGWRGGGTSLPVAPMAASVRRGGQGWRARDQGLRARVRNTEGARAARRAGRLPGSHSHADTHARRQDPQRPCLWESTQRATRSDSRGSEAGGPEGPQQRHDVASSERGALVLQGMQGFAGDVASPYPLILHHLVQSRPGGASNIPCKPLQSRMPHPKWQPLGAQRPKRGDYDDGNEHNHPVRGG